ncbi:MAG: (2Fe-2S)-binding protein [Deltaproteobacteria bacterium]|nr:(2Fe-2S)-binding protein [Deltaproteobacteria bacterium]
MLTVNGEAYELAVAPNDMLLDVIRDKLDLTGAKKGCDTGACGACTVIMDGEPILSCMTLAVRCHGREITTIEGLAPRGELHPLQQAAIDHNAVQCGFCTPGWLLSAKALLDGNPHPSQEEVRTAIAGNLCRCTGYKKIEDAISAVAGRNQGVVKGKNRD